MAQAHTTIENPAYRAVLDGKRVVLTLAHVDGGTTTELRGVQLKPEAKDWLVRSGMDVMLVREWPLPVDAEERRYNTWIIRHNNREIGRVPVPLTVLEANRTYAISRALGIPERMAAPE